ncbi:hypothetical protein RYX36_022637, partial [Vicia faba]
HLVCEIAQDFKTDLHFQTSSVNPLYLVREIAQDFKTDLCFQTSTVNPFVYPAPHIPHLITINLTNNRITPNSTSHIAIEPQKQNI